MGKPRLFVEVGQRIGAGIVIEVGLRIPRGTGSPNRTDRAARLQCDCGNEYALPIHKLIGQRNVCMSCGCLTAQLRITTRATTLEAAAAAGRRRSHNFVDRTGQKFGKLLVLGLGSPAPGGKTRWLCRCDCGNEKDIRAECLSKGISRSCGCSAGEPKLPPGVAARNQVLKGYKGNCARARGLAWELSNDEFDRLTAQDCFYCGSPPSTTKVVGSSRFTYNGIDRVDNSLGYSLENVVTCCQICNRAKSNLPYDEFMAWVGHLTAHQWFSPEQLPSRLLRGAA